METTADPAAHIASVIDLLLTIGYVDGLLHQDEKAFIREYLDRLVAHVGQPKDRVDEIYGRLDAEISGIAAEVVSTGDDRCTSTRLKVHDELLAYFHAAPAAPIRSGSGPRHAVPWPIQYQAFNQPSHNGLYR